MANTKSVMIAGKAPFTVTEHVPLHAKLAYIAGPVSGLVLEWAAGGPIAMRANEHGGKTAIYAFKLIGHDSVSWSWLDSFKREIEAAGGEITADRTVDVEGS